MKPVEECTVGIAGLGLMGGAIASALLECGASIPENILAFDKNEETLARAMKAGVIGGGFTDGKKMIEKCDLIFLCLNPQTLIRFMEERIDDFKSGALITDIAGTKANICAAAERLIRKDLDFIPGHPMAGAEKGGFENSGLVSFKGKNYIITPLKSNRPENLDFIKALINRMGFSRITVTTAEEHDSKIAFTSQLCHVIASALIDCSNNLFPLEKEITRFGGGSFEDLTRIAMLNVPMWKELFLENRTELVKCIQYFEGSLSLLKSMIEHERSPELEEKLLAVREKRSVMR